MSGANTNGPTINLPGGLTGELPKAVYVALADRHPNGAEVREMFEGMRRPDRYYRHQAARALGYVERRSFLAVRLDEWTLKRLPRKVRLNMLRYASIGPSGRNRNPSKEVLAMAYRAGGLPGLAAAAGPGLEITELERLVSGGDTIWYANPDVDGLELPDEVHGIYVGDRDDITSSLGIDLAGDEFGVIEDGCLYLVSDDLGCFLIDEVGKFAICFTGECRPMNEVQAERDAAVKVALDRWRAFPPPR